eukprot:TRINITY_DN8450_c0_g1_i1.p1 TRINITY_DN8450_c0_g1~~TRINITY_DN8450_c0_g1_i1.p1  ORF type:complete len:137 (+),score=55.51 TRINITY_DN8450_c0_g1_i1:23-433(+)
MRQVMGVPQQRNELKSSLNQLKSLVEANYTEETKRISQFKESQEKSFQILLSMLAALIIPFTLVSGIFGMNNNHMEISWHYLMMVTAILSFSLFFLLLTWMAMMYRKQKSLLNERISQIQEEDIDTGHFITHLWKF